MWLIEFLVFFSGWLLYLDAFIILMPLLFVSLQCFMPLHYLGAFL